MPKNGRVGRIPEKPIEVREQAIRLYYDPVTPRTVTEIAAELGVGRTTVDRWIDRFKREEAESQYTQITNTGKPDFTRLRAHAYKELVRKVYDGDWSAIRAVLGGDLKVFEEQTKEKLTRKKAEADAKLTGAEEAFT